MVMHPGMMSPLKAQPEVDVHDEQELQAMERRFGDGVSSAEILRFFQDRGMKLSEGTFRKYVQLGLLSRSKRVGKKGKHQGSKGLYPVGILRQILAIKRMMADGLTIEQLQMSWLRFRPRIDGVETDLTELLDDMAREVEGPRFDTQRRQHVVGEIEATRKDAQDLFRRLLLLEHEVAWSPDSAASETDWEEGEEERPAGRFF